MAALTSKSSGSALSHYVYHTPVGRVTIEGNDHAITRLVLGPAVFDSAIKSTAVTNRAATQIQEYLAGKRQAFDVPLEPAGSDFQRDVWSKIQSIPYGETMSYSALAQSLGKPGSFRAVGQAANKNPILILIPCHRLVGADGGLVGYAAGLHVKEFLLNLEAGAGQRP